jgi:hypothetical protein
MSLEQEIRKEQNEVLTETADKLKKIEELVRMGIMPIENLPFLKRAFVHAENNMFMPHGERKIFYDFINELMDITLNDVTINRLVKQKVAASKFNEEVESVEEAIIAPKTQTKIPDEAKAKAAADMAAAKKKREDALASAKAELASASKKDLSDTMRKHMFKKEDVELKKAPEGMLMTFANLVKSKVRAGGKPTEGDKKLVSKAKNELRRRRNVMSKRMSEEADVSYNEKVQKAMKKFNVSSLKDLPTDKKKDFFNYLDSIHIAKGE